MSPYVGELSSAYKCYSNGDTVVNGGAVMNGDAAVIRLVMVLCHNVLRNECLSGGPSADVMPRWSAVVRPSN